MKLPPYRALLAVDIVKFSRAKGIYLGDMREQVPRVLERAMSLSGLQEAWDSRRFPASAGDDYVFGTDPTWLPLLISPLMGSLQTVLEEVDHELAARDRDLRLRLRAALHVGPVHDSGDEWRDRIGEPTVTTFRLLSSTVISDALARSHPGVTQIALIVSQRVFDDVIRPGYATLHPSEFTPVTAEVPGKDFAEPAWLYVPRPSRREGRDDDTAASAASGEEKADRPSAESGPLAVFHGPVGQSNSAHEMHVSQTLPPDFFGKEPKRGHDD
ncbi:hypothetical protein [Nonomuraea endophytica]|uniref:Guanylate cyclase domain-containing protein n=1 Tax=Nonomuraea endophytica TaxID=714136 RepID=A0A7W8ABU0_9ACTN|nr:hypothetical protein [Nonomuraea endophytica]MBB5081888.1 hypothetical protein [Nonomuraea endophytica]